MGGCWPYCLSHPESLPRLRDPQDGVSPSETSLGSVWGGGGGQARTSHMFRQRLGEREGGGNWCWGVVEAGPIGVLL